MDTQRYKLLLVLACLAEAAFLAMLRLGDFKKELGGFLALYLGVSLFYLVCCFLITRAGPSAGTSASSGAGGQRRTMALIWIAGLVFRLTVLPLDPGLSEDLNRYRWQGKLQAAGGNPYTDIPEDPRWSKLRDETWPRVNRKDLPSVYGPLYEGLFRAYYPLAAAIEPDPVKQTWWFKLPFLFFELLLGLVVARLLRLMGRAPEWLLVYWWSPLIVIEIWAQGHNDSLAMLLLVGALAAALADRWTVAFAGLTLSAAAKFWPALLFPFFLLRREQGRWRLRWKPALVTVPVALAVSWPYLGGIENVVDLLEGFLGGWRNNDSLYGLIYDWADRDFDAGTELVTRLLTGALAALWCVQLPLVRAAKWTAALLLFFSANCFPWYLSWLVPFLAVYPNAALLLWTALVALSYHVLIGYDALGAWEYSDEFRQLEYLPVYGLLLGGGLVRGLKRLAHRGWKPGRAEAKGEATEP